MLTIADTIYPARFDRLESIILAIQDGDTHRAEALIAETTSLLPQISCQPERLQTQLFLDAVRNRLNNAGETENLYLVPDEGQQIKMFNLMAEKFPVVRQAQSLANRIFHSRVYGEECFAILDIGIGTGQQAASLIEGLVSQQSPIRRISVLGIEPSAESVEQAENRFQALAKAHNLEICFTGIRKTVEQLTQQDWDLLRAKIEEADGKLLLNASFALHHIRPLGFRTELFRQLKTLNPEVFVIIEPYADYTSDNLMERFQNAWHHYGLTFLAIDTIDASESEKSAVKQVFFGREMMDVLGMGERVEQFETAELWLERLVQAGFTPERMSHPLPDGFNALIQIEHAGAYVGFNVNAHPIVAVICAV